MSFPMLLFSDDNSSDYPFCDDGEDFPFFGGHYSLVRLLPVLQTILDIVEFAYVDNANPLIDEPSSTPCPFPFVPGVSFR